MNEKDLNWIRDALSKVRALDRVSKARHEGRLVVIMPVGNYGKVTVPYSSISDGLERTRHDLAAMLKVKGYDGPETAGVEMVTDGDGRRTAKAAPIILSEEEVDAEDGEDAGNAVHVPGAKFPLYWDKEYFVVRLKEHKSEVTCGVCEGRGKVELYDTRLQKKALHVCPSCGGHRSVVGTIKSEYMVYAYLIESVIRRNCGNRYEVRFAPAADNGNGAFDLYGDMLANMKTIDGDAVYDNFSEARLAADELNAELRKGAAK